MLFPLKQSGTCKVDKAEQGKKNARNERWQAVKRLKRRSPIRRVQVGQWTAL